MPMPNELTSNPRPAASIINVKQRRDGGHNETGTTKELDQVNSICDIAVFYFFSPQIKIICLILERKLSQFY